MHLWIWLPLLRKQFAKVRGEGDELRGILEFGGHITNFHGDFPLIPSNRVRATIRTLEKWHIPLLSRCSTDSTSACSIAMRVCDTLFAHNTQQLVNVRQAPLKDIQHGCADLRGQPS